MVLKYQSSARPWIFMPCTWILFLSTSFSLHFSRPFSPDFVKSQIICVLVSHKFRKFPSTSSLVTWKSIVPIFIFATINVSIVQENPKFLAVQSICLMSHKPTKVWYLYFCLSALSQIASTFPWSTHLSKFQGNPRFPVILFFLE